MSIRKIDRFHFPPKGLFANLSQHTAKKREKDLDRYLTCLLEDPIVRNSWELWRFLGVYRLFRSHTSDHRGNFRKVFLEPIVCTKAQLKEIDNQRGMDD